MSSVHTKTQRKRERETMIQSTLDLLSSWLTPTSLFVLVNLVIGTIAIASHLNTQKKPNEEQLLDNNSMPRSLTRAPSVIDRVKSINLSLFKFDSPETHYKEPTHPELEPQLTGAPSLMRRLSSFNLSSFRNTSENSGTTTLEQPGDVHEVKRCMSEPDAKKVAVSEKLKKSASFGYFEEEEEEDDERVVEKRRPATTKLEKTVPICDEKINQKADDFINKFKQQLRLQRLDSILKYKDMLGRGSAKEG